MSIIEEGVTQCDNKVTTSVARNICNNRTAMCQMARFAKVDTIPVDIGMKETFCDKRLLDYSIKKGTNNFLKAPAMTRDEAIKAILAGVEIAEKLKNQGYKMLLTGEMGIGNTTTTAVLTCAVLNQTPELVTGKERGSI